MRFPWSPQCPCLSGVVSLFRFIQAPPPGSVIGTLTLGDGTQVGVRQTNPTDQLLSQTEGRFVTLCGPLTVMQGQPVLDVRLVMPGSWA